MDARAFFSTRARFWCHTCTQTYGPGYKIRGRHIFQTRINKESEFFIWQYTVYTTTPQKCKSRVEIPRFTMYGNCGHFTLPILGNCTPNQTKSWVGSSDTVLDTSIKGYIWTKRIVVYPEILYLFSDWHYQKLLLVGWLLLEGRKKR